jgi:hypothetical protein
MALSQWVPEWMQIALVALFGAWVLHRIALSYLAQRSDRRFWDMLASEVLPKFVELMETAKVDANAHAKLKLLDKRQEDTGIGMAGLHGAVDGQRDRLAAVEAVMEQRLNELEAAEKKRADAQGQGQLPLE